MMPNTDHQKLLYFLLCEKQERKREESIKSHLEYMKNTWNNPEPFKIGVHTRAICDRIDRAIEDYTNGKSTYLIITVPPRHGKSDMVSRFLPGRLLGLFPDNEIMLMSYNQPLAIKMSRGAKKVIESEKYKCIFPEIELSKNANASEYWEIENRKGSFLAAGILSGVTGSGYHFGIIDDYCKGRENAESEVQRETAWNVFSNDFFTRKAPVSITIIMATTWHIDDLIGRIKKKMSEDSNFPQFEIINFPAESKDYKTGYLFPERFSDTYYKEARQVLGKYSYSALYMQDPQIKGGNILKTDKINIIQENELPRNLKWCRGWDLASSEKERIKDDPDRTAGVLIARTDEATNIEGLFLTRIYIKDITKGRWEAPQRDRVILQTTARDGDGVVVATESVAGYKDTYTTLKSILKGVRVVKKINTTIDLIARTSPLEAIFEAGNVYLVEGPWNDDFISEVAAFSGKSSKHDDQIAAMVTGFEALYSYTLKISNKTMEMLKNRQQEIIRRDEEAFIF